MRVPASGRFVIPISAKRRQAPPENPRCRGNDTTFLPIGWACFARRRVTKKSRQLFRELGRLSGIIRDESAGAYTRFHRKSSKGIIYLAESLHNA